jgi:hypothetical protein
MGITLINIRSLSLVGPVPQSPWGTCFNAQSSVDEEWTCDLRCDLYGEKRKLRVIYLLTKILFLVSSVTPEKSIDT